MKFFDFFIDVFDVLSVSFILSLIELFDVVFFELVTEFTFDFGFFFGFLFK